MKNIPERTVTVSGFTARTTRLSDVVNTRKKTRKLGYKPSKQAKMSTRAWISMVEGGYKVTIISGRTLVLGCMVAQLEAL
ncbi:hypothetical protein AMECASPLE_004199 [Ameca splendens]|uniref:Uncharacterized protein n=1 Tax=Ameca splendens TaxID=208324 RepID=A0ABV1A6M8_9TELE